MEKLSVNGKSFDEIFDQRGDFIDNLCFVSNEVYLNTWDEEGVSASWIFEQAKDGQLDIVKPICTISYNGRFFRFSDSVKVRISNSDKFFKATTDQIALLNLYKSQCGK